MNRAFPLSDEYFDPVFDTCCSLINLELETNPLDETEGNEYNSYLINLKKKYKKRKETNSKNVKKCRQKSKEILRALLLEDNNEMNSSDEN